ncbi:dynamin family protein [Actinomycetaceae bacterium MB13-C1-2]|nr:dynamin family protein [Actinomycetaceae bacterium MB13-C1-2]
MVESIIGDEAEALAISGLVAAVDGVRGRLAAVTLPLEGAGVSSARIRRQQIIAQIDDYLLPRLRSEGAPLLVVVGGSTGAGKSTLVNSLLGEPLTTPGVLRPTTRSPVLVYHPADSPWFAPERILPNLARVSTSRAQDDLGGVHEGAVPVGVRALRLAPFAGMPPGLALLDAPDIDSVEEGNRQLATQLLAAADLWLFVTTAARYADAVPWELLREAADRHAQVALVVDRVDPGAEAVVADLRRMMDQNGLKDAPLFAVPESDLDDQGMLPALTVAEVAGWLTDLGGNPAARAGVAMATRDGVIGDLTSSVREIAVAADGQAESARRLEDTVRGAYKDALSRIEQSTSDGAMLRGEVLTRWQDFVGASDLMRSIERGVSSVRDRITGFFRGGKADIQPVELALAHGLEAVTIDAMEGTRERVRSAWRSDPAGSGLLAHSNATAGITGVDTSEMRAAVAEQIRLWQDDVLEIVSTQGASKRGLARGLSYGVNALSVALMLVVFGATGGLTGVELGIAGGTAVLAQKMLEAVFGDDAVRKLTTEASAKLNQRLSGLLEADASVLMNMVEALGISDRAGDELRVAADQLARADAAESAAREASPVVLSVSPAPLLRGAELRGTLPTWSRQEASPEPSASEKVNKKTPFWRRVFGGTG